MRTENAVSAIKRNCCVFNMNVIDSVDKVLKEYVRCDSLPYEMARIEVKAKLRSVFKFLQEFFR